MLFFLHLTMKNRLKIPLILWQKVHCVTLKKRNFWFLILLFIFTVEHRLKNIPCLVDSKRFWNVSNQEWREKVFFWKKREQKKWSKNEAYGPGLIHVKNSLSVQVTHMVYIFHSVWLVMKIKRMKNHIHVHEKSKVTTCKYSTMNAKEWDGEMDEKCKMNEKIPGGWQTTNEPLLISIHYLACKIG